MSEDSVNTREGWKSFLRRRHLTSRQVFRVKFASAVTFTLVAFSLLAEGMADHLVTKNTWAGTDYTKREE